MTLLKTIATAEPSVAPPPMIRHIIERTPDPEKPGSFLADFKDEALCGYLWDRLLCEHLNPGPFCSKCAEVLRSRAER